ncbi:MAG: tail fiber protein [Pseudolabrys sp.]|nr:tail fiber protein [Pseudolabrys sp.]MDP2295532.1 tail fiber protein [Pseudolabrys sp.]
MSEPFIGQIQSFGFGFAPKNWALCNGQILPIAQNSALFSLLGTNYGGNGTTTFALPNLQSRVPLHFGTSPQGENYVLGEQAGVEHVTLLTTQMPAHNHHFVGSAANANAIAADDGGLLATCTAPSGAGTPYYSADSGPPLPLIPESIQVAGGQLPHNNLQPYLTINWCIALRGIFPSRN